MGSSHSILSEDYLISTGKLKTPDMRKNAVSDTISAINYANCITLYIVKSKKSVMRTVTLKKSNGRLVTCDVDGCHQDSIFDIDDKNDVNILSDIISSLLFNGSGYDIIETK